MQLGLAAHHVQEDECYRTRKRAYSGAENVQRSTLGSPAQTAVMANNAEGGSASTVRANGI